MCSYISAGVLAWVLGTFVFIGLSGYQRGFTLGAAILTHNCLVAVSYFLTILSSRMESKACFADSKI